MINRIKQSLTCDQLMVERGIQKKGANYPCPFHEDRNASFSTYENGEKWKCFTCDIGGDVIDLYQQFNKCDKKTAIEELFTRVGGSVFVPRFEKQVEENKEVKEFLKSRNIDYNKVKDFVGYDKKENSISCVLRDENEEIGIQRRSITEKRFKIEGKSGFLYNAKSKSDTLYIVEGLTDWLTIRQFDEHVLGFISATSFPECPKIINKYKNVYWLGDDDEPGKKLRSKFIERYSYPNVYTIDKRGDVNENYREDMIDWIKSKSKQVREGRRFFENVSYAMSTIVDEMETKSEDIISYGIDKLDKIIGGVFPSSLVVVASETGAGKSEFLGNIAFNTAKKGKKVLYFDLENDFGDIIRRRMISEYNSFNSDKINIINTRSNKIYKDEKQAEKLFKIMGEIENKLEGNLLIYDSKTIPTFDDFQNYLSLVNDVDLVVIDHLHYFAFEDEELLSAQLGKIMRSFRVMTKQKKIPILTASHLRKLPAKENYAPTNDDIFGSSNIAKEAETVIMLSRLKDDNYNTRVSITKNRIGGIIKTFKANFDTKKRKIVEPLVDFDEISYKIK